MNTQERQELYKSQGSIATLVLGLSGRGKSTSLRNMNPDTTFLFNVMGKPLPFPGGMANYKVGKNMLVEKSASVIVTELKKFQKTDYLPNVTDIVIDDAQYIMIAEFMQKVMIAGWDKWNIMAKNIWEVITTGSILRDGLKVFILSHEEDDGIQRKMKTLGKLLDGTIDPAGLLAIVLFAASTSDVPPRYVFQTQTDGRSSAKSPMGMFPLVMENDLALVSQRIDEYYAGVALEASNIKFVQPIIKK